MLFYLHIYSSYLKRKVKHVIYRHGHKISDALSPEISLIVSDTLPSETATPAPDVKSSIKVGTHIQKASEPNQKSIVENHIVEVAKVYGIAIFSCEKFLNWIEVPTNKISNSNYFQELPRKVDQENLNAILKNGKSSIQFRRMDARPNMPRRLFTKNSKFPRKSAMNTVHELKRNFIKVEDCNLEVRPMYKMDVFQKLVVCRCEPSVFHSTHIQEKDSSQTSRSCQQKNNYLTKNKYLNLSGDCEVCEMSFYCMWNHVTGETHKKNVCHLSYSEVDELLSLFPSIDDFLGKYCAGTNDDSVSLKRSEKPFKCENKKEINSKIISNNEESNSQVSLHVKNEIDQEAIKPSEKTALPSCKLPSPALLVPNQQVKLSGPNCPTSLFKQVQLTIQNLLTPLSVANPCTMRYNTVIPSLDFKSSDPELNISSDFRNLWKILPSYLKSDIVANCQRLSSQEFLDPIYSGLINKDQLWKDCSSFLNDTHEILDCSRSEKGEQNDTPDSIDPERPEELFLQHISRDIAPSACHYKTVQNIPPDVFNSNQSPQIEPILDTCKNSGINTNRCLKPFKIVMKGDEVAKIKNKGIKKECDMKMDNGKEEILREGLEDLAMKEKAAGKNMTDKDKEEKVQLQSYSVVKCFDTNSLNDHRKKSTNLSLRIKKLSENNFANGNTSTCITSDTSNLSNEETQKPRTPSPKLTRSKFKRQKERKWKTSDGTEKSSSGFSVNSSSKTARFNDRLSNSLPPQSSLLPSHRRLNLETKKTEITSPMEISSSSKCLMKSGQCYSLSTSYECGCELNISLQRKACSVCPSIANVSVSSIKSDFGQRKETEDENLSLDKQSDKEASPTDPEELSCSISVQMNYTAPNASVSARKHVHKISKNVESKNNSDYWNVKFQRDLTMILSKT